MVFRITVLKKKSKTGKISSRFVINLYVHAQSVMSDFTTPQTVARQAPLSMGFPRQEYWSVLPSPSLGDLPDPGIEPGSPSFQADALTTGPPGKPKPPQKEITRTRSLHR